VSHGLAVQAFRSSGASGAIGITLNLFPTVPATVSEADAEAARGSDGYTNRWYLDPVLRGSYPDDTHALFERVLGRPLEFVRDGDLDAAGTGTDFLGVNYYHPRVMRSAPGERFGWKVVEGARTGLSTTGLGYEIVPEGLFDLLTGIARDYPGVPLYITENGAAFPDAPDADGSVRDPERIDFLRGHLDAAARAIAAGVDLRGYFAWSLMDNFEWALGYGPRFGLVHTDYRTLARSRKSSFAYYRDVIAANAVVD
jgi:beta-glucosidase